MSRLGTYYGTSSTEVTGSRGWVFDDETGLLRSSTGGAIWPLHEPATASCQSHRFVRDYRVMGRNPGSAPGTPHPTPDESCECGIHAYRKPSPMPLAAEVMGEVRLWGRVVMHAKGYRASHAYPSRLWVHEDGGVDGRERAARIVERLREYNVTVGVLQYDFVDDLIARELRTAWTPEGGPARIGRIAWTAREHLDAGRREEAFGVVLDELLTVDLREIHPGCQMGQGLRGSSFLHSETSRRWVSAVDGESGSQVITVKSLSGAPMCYYGPQTVVLDTRIGAIEERFSQCAGPRHRGHEPWSQHRESELTIRRIGSSLQLETWIQLLTWHADPGVRATAAALRASQ